MIVKPGKGDQQPTTLAVCVNHRFGADRPSCAGRGGLALLERLTDAAAARGLNVRVERICCFGFCAEGPNMRLFPGGPHFYEVTEGDIPEVLDEVEKACGRRPEGDVLAALRLMGS